MAATLRELRGRIRSAGSIKKITKAQEMIATSRIGKAQARLQEARPYADELTRVLTTLAKKPLWTIRCWSSTEPKRAGVLVVSSDRGLCGAYNSGAFRRAEELFSLLRESGKTPVLYTVGRKALGYYSFRNWDISRVMDRLLGATQLRERRGGRRDPGSAFMAGAGDDGTTELRSRRRRTAHRLHRVQIDDVADRSRRTASPRWSWNTSRTTTSPTRCTRSSRMRRHSSTRCCRGTCHPRVHGAARVRRIRAGITPTGDEIGQRQRRRPHQGTHARGQP